MEEEKVEIRKERLSTLGNSLSKDTEGEMVLRWRASELSSTHLELVCRNEYSMVSGFSNQFTVPNSLLMAPPLSTRFPEWRPPVSLISCLVVEKEELNNCFILMKLFMDTTKKFARYFLKRNSWAVYPAAVSVVIPVSHYSLRHHQSLDI